MHRIINSLHIAFGEILNNKVRSLLSVFAISIGVLVFLFVFSAINYAKEVKAKQLAVAGKNVFYVTMYNGDFSRLKMKDIEEMETTFPDLTFIAPRSEITDLNTIWNNKYYETTLIGITPNHMKFDWVYTNLKGRFISWDDVNNRNKVAVHVKNPTKNEKANYTNNRRSVSYSWSRHKDERVKWSDKQDLIGEKIKIFGDIYTVIGSIEAPLFEDDNRVEKYKVDFFIPISAYMDSFINNYMYVVASFEDKRTFPALKKRILNFLKKRSKSTNNNDEFVIKTYEDIIANNLKTMEENIKLISILGLIALISGGIGIMNVILATIYARIKEIGTRRALGASKTDIFMQFSAESVILSLLGALMGLVFSHFLFDYLGDIIKIQTSFNWIAVCGAFAMALITGLIFSIYPALKAANMDPVEALKIE